MTQQQFDFDREKRLAFWRANPDAVYPCQCATCTAYRESKAADHG